MEEEHYFPATKTIVENYKKISTTGLVPKHWHRFSYIHSENYEIDLYFDETEMKIKSDHFSDNKVKLFCENIAVGGKNGLTA